MHRIAIALATGRRRLAAVAVILALIAATTGLVFAHGGARDVHADGFVGPSAYGVIVGDSLAAGEQPDSSFGDGYAQDWASEIHLRHPGFQLADYGCVGETTSSFRTGPAGTPCRIAFTETSQLQAAVNFIHQHLGHVSPVVYGGTGMLNDFAGRCYSQVTGVDAVCAEVLIPQIQANVAASLKQLRQALGGEGDLFVLNDYNPLAVLDPRTTTPTDWVGKLNAAVAAAAQQQHATLIDVHAIIQPNLCVYTNDCQLPPPLALDPNPAGYAAIAAELERVAGY